MTVSTIPALFALQLVFMFWVSVKARSTPALVAATVTAVIFSLWGAASAAMALNGVYETDWFLRLFPGLWLPAVPFVLAAVMLVIPAVRNGFLSMCDATPDHWFVAIQALRVTALGTLIKTIQGDFPLEVELAIGVTDLAFGLSAIWLFFKVRRGAISSDALMLWHIVGVLIIILPGELAMQSGLPGPMRVFTEYPTSEVMLDWPMVLAPSLVVPGFLLLNIFAAIAASRRRASRPIERINTHV